MPLPPHRRGGPPQAVAAGLGLARAEAIACARAFSPYTRRMRSTLKPGLTHEHRYRVPETKTVPHVYAESELFRPMPPVFATAFLVGLVEWACMELLRDHLDAGEATVGTDVKLSHTAATPVGATVTVSVRLEAVEGRRLVFSASAHDGQDEITRGSHERFVIDTEKFTRKVGEKARALGV